MFSKQTHDLMRKLQLIFAAASGSLAIITAAVDMGLVGAICTAVLSAAGYFVGQLAQDDSDKYYETRMVVDKNVGDV